MPTIVLVRDGVLTHPYSVAQFRRDNPLISLPMSPTPEQLAEVGLYEVAETPRPELANDEVITGWTIDLVDGVPTWQWIVEQREPEPQYVPDAVDMAQARLALLGAGITKDVVNAEIDKLPVEQQEAARIEWEYRTIVRRNSPLVSLIGPALGLTDEQIDALFITASSL